MSSIFKNDMFRREGSSGYHSFYGWLKVHWVCIFRRKGYQADRKMQLHNGHYILGISIFIIFWNLKVHVTLTKTRKWSKTRMKAIYCAFESWYIIFLIYEILGTIWVPYYGCIEVWKEENCDKLRFLRCHFDEIYGSAWYPNGTQNFMMPKHDI